MLPVRGEHKELAMSARQRLCIGAAILATAMFCAGCSTVPSPPDAVGDDYPGTCMPPELSWPTDFLESLPGESTAVGGTIVGLRLEYVDSEWVWRLRSVATKYDMFGERVEDPSFGKESLVDVRTLEPLVTQDVKLTDAETQLVGIGVYEAAHLSGEEWPSPLIVEMARVMEDGAPVWRITTCNTETNEQTVTTLS
jgi:hypothetical protein